MNILIVCNWGKNRSAYLASYLKEKGYKVKFAGIFDVSENPVTQDVLDWSSIIVFVQQKTKENFLEKFKVENQKVITLNVEDRIEVLASKKDEIDKMEWLAIQEKFVYPELERQIEEYLPFNDK